MVVEEEKIEGKSEKSQRVKEKRKKSWGQKEKGDLGERFTGLGADGEKQEENEK